MWWTWRDALTVAPGVRETAPAPPRGSHLWWWCCQNLMGNYLGFPSAKNESGKWFALLHPNRITDFAFHTHVPQIPNLCPLSSLLPILNEQVLSRIIHSHSTVGMTFILADMNQLQGLLTRNVEWFAFSQRDIRDAGVGCPGIRLGVQVSQRTHNKVGGQHKTHHGVPAPITCTRLTGEETAPALTQRGLTPQPGHHRVGFKDLALQM